ncbi:MAG: hypothetical protein JXA52_02310 [Planctomycetes bacterium]|nr:hypothetical protein [Planctomycetota bacterium]
MLYARVFVTLGICIALLGGIAIAADEAPEKIPFTAGMKTPEPGEGYSYCLKTEPAVYKTVTHEVESAKASSYLEPVPAEYEEKDVTILIAPEKRIPRLVSPAKYKTVEIKELAQSASEDIVVIPAEWKWTEKTVVVREAHKDQSIAPATYKTVSETIEVAPERSTVARTECVKGMTCYVKGECPAQNITVKKEVLDMPEKKTDIDIPALTKTIRIRELVKPASTKTVKVPEQYQTYTKQVLEAPAEYAYDTVPAKYKTIKKLVLTKAETTKLVNLPAKTETITEKVLDKPASMYWVKMPLSNVPKVSQVLSKYESFPCASAEALR